MYSWGATTVVQETRLKVHGNRRNPLLCFLESPSDEAENIEENEENRRYSDPADRELVDMFSEYYQPYVLTVLESLYPHLMQKSCRYAMRIFYLVTVSMYYLASGWWEKRHCAMKFSEPQNPLPLPSWKIFLWNLNEPENYFWKFTAKGDILPCEQYSPTRYHIEKVPKNRVLCRRVSDMLNFTVKYASAEMC